jgi:uncharacterized protein YndB with AHSA1/START domain
MTTTTHPETTISADPALPTIHITREFNAPVDAVFRAHVEQDLATKWLGPRDLTMRVERWDASTGGAYGYVHSQGGEEYRFFGSFHEVRLNERIVQTFTYEGFPDSVSLEAMTFEDLGGGRTRIHSTSVFETKEARDMMLASGMETGVVEGYEKLDDLLAEA